ncbi:TonB family protein [Sphingomonas sp. 7/4-4]|uniref:energy transducer TonB n=1 Tax=Sphingomonas sp. 7/4-4 TaxID=3018446 RepID=UPI0022F3FC95|nr:energy transducer TonB [Sphingomonas sp. 7/4-4]WBY06893.1 TonB family protein [Sphingomonas sp. 7/4-4]
MYAEHRYAPPKSRTVSLGSALLINGALIAGLIFAAPNVIPKGPEDGINVIPIRDPLEPPPIDLPKPKPDNRAAQNPTPQAPDPFIKSESENTTKTTTDIGDPPLRPMPKAEEGPIFVPEPPPPLPPLLRAEQDSRFARDFQPAYPSTELRAQRDGFVQIKVLIGVDGRVKAAQSVSATSDAFFEATRRQALSKWRFKPATRGGIPEESWKTLSVRFLIKDQ